MSASTELSYSCPSCDSLHQRIHSLSRLCSSLNTTVLQLKSLQRNDLKVRKIEYLESKNRAMESQQKLLVQMAKRLGASEREIMNIVTESNTHLPSSSSPLVISLEDEKTNSTPIDHHNPLPPLIAKSSSSSLSSSYSPPRSRPLKSKTSLTFHNNDSLHETKQISTSSGHSKEPLFEEQEEEQEHKNPFSSSSSSSSSTISLPPSSPSPSSSSSSSPSSLPLSLTSSSLLISLESDVLHSLRRFSSLSDKESTLIERVSHCIKESGKWKKLAETMKLERDSLVIKCDKMKHKIENIQNHHAFIKEIKYQNENDKKARDQKGKGKEKEKGKGKEHEDGDDDIFDSTDDGDHHDENDPLSLHSSSSSLSSTHRVYYVQEIRSLKRKILYLTNAFAKAIEEDRKHYGGGGGGGEKIKEKEIRSLTSLCEEHEETILKQHKQLSEKNKIIKQLKGNVQSN